MSILSSLKSLVTSAEYADAIASIERELVDARANFTALEASREAAIFDGGAGAIERVAKEIETARDQIETLEAALAGARRRKADAAEREHRTDVEAKVASAPKLVSEIIDLRKALHPEILAVIAKIERLRQAQAELAALNRYATSEGRKDLRAEVPMREWHETARLARIEASVAKQRAAGAGSPRVPSNLEGPGATVDMPMPEDLTFHIAGYPVDLPTWQEHWLESVFPELKSPPAPSGGGGILRRLAGGNGVLAPSTV